MTGDQPCDYRGASVDPAACDRIIRPPLELKQGLRLVPVRQKVLEKLPHRCGNRPMGAQQIKIAGKVKRGSFGAKQDARSEVPVNGAAIFLKSGAAKFPSLAGLGCSAVWVIGASVLWRPATTVEGRRNGICGVGLKAEGLGQEIGMLA
jgi:hypothetical protein